jgi:AAA domain
VDIKSLRPAKDFANMFGVKSIIYGPPGSAKTPLINTCPRPLLLACEPGLLSMRGSNVPTFAAFTATLVDEFMKWFFNSNERKNFDTIAIDSVSHMSELYLVDALKNNKHGLKAYGEMATKTLEQLNGLYFSQNIHTYLIAKEAAIDDNGVRIRKPYFPGQQLMVEVPHKFDLIMRLAQHNVPGVGQTRAFRCIGSLEEMARDRTGRLNEFEPPNFSDIVKKAMQ